ncbi:VOC family protein [Halorhabdus sp. CUG00001]|uniref:VOC family protein n=1 Tax=Halorhabdus sp. CUG00001 TaxID=2600297 RepID=UPI00131B76FA|nr:VOC family protein [Halorhabdus sp. CUG00001]
MNLTHVALWVSKLDRSLSFYGDLGFERTCSFTADGVENVYLSAGDGELQLKHDPTRTTPIAPSRADTDHVAFLVEDVERVAEQARKAGGSVRTEPHVVKAADAKATFLEDPDGHTIEFYRPLDG